MELEFCAVCRLDGFQSSIKLGDTKYTESHVAVEILRNLTFLTKNIWTFQVLDNPDPVVVDFSATWCGPCKLLTPRLDAAVAATGGKVHLAMVDIDDLGDLALDNGVQAVPTVLAVKEGKEVDRFVGLVDEDKLGAFVDKLAS